jgi:hypothetical protein
VSAFRDPIGSESSEANHRLAINEVSVARPVIRIVSSLGLLVVFARPALGTPIGAFGGSAGAYARFRSGFLFGADTGIATLVSSDEDSIARVEPTTTPKYHGWAFGVRTGYEWTNGIALQARVDDLGTHTGSGNQPLSIASVGLRYSLPFVVMPFVDALVGPAFDNSGTSLGAAIGIGASIIVTRHLGVDVAVRDWMADLGGGIRHIPTVTLGVQLGFGH